MVSAVVETTVVAIAVVSTAVMATVANVAGEGAGRYQAIHHERDSGDRGIILTAELRFPQDAPDDQDAAGHEPHEGRLSDLL
jgi:hypothetical protein